MNGTYIIIGRALARIAEYLPRFVHLLEFLVGAAFVRVVHESSLVEAFFKLVLVVSAVSMKNVVVVLLLVHLN